MKKIEKKSEKFEPIQKKVYTFVVSLNRFKEIIPH